MTNSLLALHCENIGDWPIFFMEQATIHNAALNKIFVDFKRCGDEGQIIG